VLTSGGISAYGLGPYYGSLGGPRIALLYPGPQVVAIPVTVLSRSSDVPSDFSPDNGLTHIPPRRRDRVEDLPPADPVAPGQNVGVFQPLDPANRQRARQPVEPDAPPAAPAKPLAAPPAIPAGASLVDRGRAAFAAGEYGQAADCFRRATSADNADPVPAFLLTETLVALGKYSAAADTARNAAARFADWPTLTIRPVDLYGARAADFAEHLNRLAETRSIYPDDPVLLFLAGHFLWFANRKDEARPLLRRAAPAIPAAERYLQAAPPTIS
jgi:hypothetical protein